MNKFCKKGDGARFVAKLKRYAQSGFARLQYEKGPIRPEWGHVFRIGNKETLFRLLGFFDHYDGCFIVIDAYSKRGQTLSGPDKARINEVARVKREGQWDKGKP